MIISKMFIKHYENKLELVNCQKNHIKYLVFHSISHSCEIVLIFFFVHCCVLLMIHTYV